VNSLYIPLILISYIPSVKLTKSDIAPEIAAGMPLTVDILGDKRTVISYIMTPIQKSWASAFREK